MRVKLGGERFRYWGLGSIFKKVVLVMRIPFLQGIKQAPRMCRVRIPRERGFLFF